MPGNRGKGESRTNKSTRSHVTSTETSSRNVSDTDTTSLQYTPDYSQISHYGHSSSITGPPQQVELTYQRPLDPGYPAFPASMRHLDENLLIYQQQLQELREHMHSSLGEYSEFTQSSGIIGDSAASSNGEQGFWQPSHGDEPNLCQQPSRLPIRSVSITCQNEIHIARGEMHAFSIGQAVIGIAWPHQDQDEVQGIDCYFRYPPRPQQGTSTAIELSTQNVTHPAGLSDLEGPGGQWLKTGGPQLGFYFGRFQGPPSSGQLFSWDV